MAVAEVYGENSSDYSNIISAQISRVAARKIKIRMPKDITIKSVFSTARAPEINRSVRILVKSSRKLRLAETLCRIK